MPTYKQGILARKMHQDADGKKSECLLPVSRAQQGSPAQGPHCVRRVRDAHAEDCSRCCCFPKVTRTWGHGGRGKGGVPSYSEHWGKAEIGQECQSVG